MDHTALPKKGTVFIAWDHAWSTKNAADNSVGAVGLLDDQRRWWIVDIIRGRFNFSEKVYQVVNSIRIHRPRRTCIEDSQGAQQSMTGDLDRQAKTAGVELAIDWIGLGRGTEDAKYIRMSALHPWVREKRLFFLNTISCIDDLVKEFVNIGNRRSRNDIPDAISRLVEQYSRAVSEVAAPTDEEALRQWHELTQREFRDMIFRKGKYSEPEPAPAPEKPDYYIDSMTGLPSPYEI